MIGRTIGKYRIVEQIGRGGMGTVYKAVDETLDRTVAIKVLNADLLDQDSVERFRREAVTLARLNHPRIGAIHELTRDGHDLLMVMEFISGETFEKVIERSAPLPIPDAVRLCVQILDGLQYAHGAGVIHRDLKPANVIVMPSGDIKIMDFGIARVQGSEHLTSVGFMVGTPAYMSPEQVRGEEVDPRMDLYSIAVVLYRLLTHRLPFQGDTAIAMIHSQLSNPPTPARQFRADLPDWIVATLARGLAKSAADRFQTASEFRAALETGLTGKMAIADILGAGQAETMPPTFTPPEMRVPRAVGTGVSPQPAAPATGSAVRPTPTFAGTPSGTAVAAGPSAASMPQPKPEATVTLRAPHLATAGILVAVLVVGIGVLAFVALRGPTTIVTPAPVAAVPAAPAPEVPTPVATPEATPVAVPTPAPAPAVADATLTTPSVKPTAPATAAPGTAATGGTATITTARGAAAPGETTARGRSTTLPATPTAVAPAVPAAPAAADAPAEHFADVKALTVDGTKTREVDTLLSLEPGTLVVRGKNDSAVLRTLSYRSITAATYARARKPRGQHMAGALDVPENFGGSGVLGGSRHWLALQTAGEFLVLRLEDRNVIRVMQAVEARTGLKVLRSQD